MSGKIEAGAGGSKYSWAVLQLKCCSKLILSSVKLTCAVMELVLGVFSYAASLEQLIVAFALRHYHAHHLWPGYCYLGDVPWN